MLILTFKQLHPSTLVLIFIHCVLIFQTSTAQQNNAHRPWVASIKSHYGIIIPHANELKSVSQSSPFGVELHLFRLNILQSDWKKCNCYSMLGFSAGYYNFANPKILGQAYNLAISIQPLIKFQNRLSFSLKLAGGVSYLTRVYDSINNPKNTFFSSPLSFMLQADFISRLRLNKQFGLVFSGCFNHISNGGIKQPNRGMNYPTLSIGFEYNINNYILNQYDNSDFRLPDKRLKIKSQISGSIKVHSETSKYPEKANIIYGINLQGTYQTGRYSAFSTGFEFFDDHFIKETIKRNELTTDHKRLSALIGHELLLGDFIFATNFGIYVYAPYSGKDSLYQRYDIIYTLSRRFFTGVYMKAHRHVAELMGVSVGYVLY